MIPATDDYKVKVFYHYRKALLSKLRRIVPNQEEDAFQNGVIKAIRYWDTCRDETTRKTWFYRIVICEGLSMLRKGKSKKESKSISIDSAYTTKSFEDYKIPELIEPYRFELHLLAKDEINKALKFIPASDHPFIQELLLERDFRSKIHGDALSIKHKMRRFRAIRRFKIALEKIA